MKKMLLMILMIQVSCPLFSIFNSSSLSPSETPTASYVVPVENFPGIVTGLVSTRDGYEVTSSEMCIYIEQMAFWEPGDFWENHENYPHVKILFDYHEATGVRFSSTGPGIGEYSSSGKLLGTHGGTFQYCVKPNLKPGIHSMTVTGTTTSGKAHTYSWNISVKQASS